MRFPLAELTKPEVRALAWGGVALFGVDRVKAVADWPLTARLPGTAPADAYDPATVFSSIDHMGRYAYANQAAAAQWNLARFAETSGYELTFGNTRRRTSPGCRHP